MVINGKRKESERPLTLADELLQTYGDPAEQRRLKELRNIQKGNGHCQLNPECKKYTPGVACKYLSRKCVGKIDID